MKNINLIVGGVISTAAGGYLVHRNGGVLDTIFGAVFLIIAIAALMPASLHTAREELTGGYRTFKNPNTPPDEPK